MGLKDLVGGLLGKGEKAKAKEEYREALKGAVLDGKLSHSDMRDLEALRQDLGVEHAAEDRTERRREIYNEAVSASKKDDGSISGTGMHELAKIQKFLALRDDQIEKTKFQVTRLRTLGEIKKGNLPVVPSSSAALRDMPLEEGEIAHYTLSVDILTTSSTRQADGVPLVPGQPYEEKSAAAHVLPEAGAKEMGEATVVITNRRLLLKTRGRVAAVKLGNEASLFLYSDGLRMQRTTGHTLLRFRSRSDEIAEIVGALLTFVMGA